MSATKSLRRRIFWGFVVCAALIWIAFVTWVIRTVLTDGQQSAEEEMTVYAQQILSLSEHLQRQPYAIARIVGDVVRLENAPTASDDHPDPIHIQIWQADKVIFASAELPTAEPKPGFNEMSALDTVWWTQTVTNDEQNLTVRLWGLSGIAAALRADRIAIFFLPLLFSLPILLLPAWFMTRSGLKPLRDVVVEIEERVTSDSRAPLSDTPYAELNPIVDATNGLMERLNVQLHRERAFAADIAHEMKTPLAIVQANVDILAGAPNPGQREQALADLKAGITRSDRLVAQLLDLMRMERGEDLMARIDAIDLAEFVRNRVGQLEPLARKRNVHLIVEAPDTAPAHINLTAFAAVVDNLLDNAIKYGPEASDVAVTLAIQSDTAQLCVQDRGRGIPIHLQDQVFERFERLDEADTNGAGLGLSIVREAVLRLNGRLEVVRTAGFAMQVTFPIEQPPRGLNA